MQSAGGIGSAASYCYGLVISPILSGIVALLLGDRSQRAADLEGACLVTVPATGARHFARTGSATLDRAVLPLR